MIVRRLEFCPRYIADWLQQPTVIEPVDPFERRVFHCLEVPPRAAPVNELGLVKPDDRLGKGVVVRIAHAAYRRLDPRFGQSLGVANRQILAAAVAVMHDSLDSGARPQRLLQRVQDQFGMHRARHAPADDAPCEHIDHKRDVNEACPRREWSERPGVVETISWPLLPEPDMHLSAHPALHSSVAESKGNVRVTRLEQAASLVS